eukprot:2405188-Ditylum_brightwellii.AAC.1
MADDTATMLSLQSTDQNDKDEWMDADDKDIDRIIQQLDYKDKLNKKNPPSAIKSSFQQSQVTTGNNNSATFVSAASSMHNVIAHSVAFSSPNEEDEIEDKYKSIGKYLQEKGAEAINAMTIMVTLVNLNSQLQ